MATTAMAAGFQARYCTNEPGRAAIVYRPDGTLTVPSAPVLADDGPMLTATVQFGWGAGRFDPRARRTRWPSIHPTIFEIGRLSARLACRGL